MQARHAWYRSTEWNPEIEERFFAKLKRARKKNQYLRIQALYLIPTHPRVALFLLDQYFLLGDPFDKPLALVHRAEAYLALSEVDNAVESYERALECERERPNYHTNASEDYALLIATKRFRDKYEGALALCRRKGVLLFPAQRFKRFAAAALMMADLGNTEIATKFATLALAEAAAQHSGLRYHPDVGLVPGEFEDVEASLRAIISAAT